MSLQSEAERPYDGKKGQSNDLCPSWVLPGCQAMAPGQALLSPTLVYTRSLKLGDSPGKPREEEDAGLTDIVSTTSRMRCILGNRLRRRTQKANEIQLRKPKVAFFFTL